MPGAVLNAFHSVSHLFSQSNYHKIHTRIPILHKKSCQDRMSTTGTATLFDVKHASPHKP